MSVISDSVVAAHGHMVVAPLLRAGGRGTQSCTTTIFDLPAPAAHHIELWTLDGDFDPTRTTRRLASSGSQEFCAVARRRTSRWYRTAALIKLERKPRLTGYTIIAQTTIAILSSPQTHHGSLASQSGAAPPSTSRGSERLPPQLPREGLARLLLGRRCHLCPEA